MAITVYTYNDKVLKNSATDKWLKKKEAPAGFIMNASNIAGSYTITTLWEGPNYPNAWDGEGKTIRLVVSEDIILPYQYFRMATGITNTDQQEFSPLIDYQYPADGIIIAGTYTYTGVAGYGIQYGYGKYIALSGVNTSDVSKITIQILNP